MNQMLFLPISRFSLQLAQEIKTYLVYVVYFFRGFSSYQRFCLPPTSSCRGNRTGFASRLIGLCPSLS